MANERKPTTEPSQPPVYQIRVRGRLGRRWTAWFEGLTITPDGNGDTLLTGPVVDQAALHGLLGRVRDLGLPLLSVMHVEAEQTQEANTRSPPSGPRSSKETSS